MAASYWTSTQYRNWTFDKQELADIRQKLEDGSRELVQQFPLPARRLFFIYICQREST